MSKRFPIGWFAEVRAEVESLCRECVPVREICRRVTWRGRHPRPSQLIQAMAAAEVDVVALRRQGRYAEAIAQAVALRNCRRAAEAHGIHPSTLAKHLTALGLLTWLGPGWRSVRARNAAMAREAKRRRSEAAERGGSWESRWEAEVQALVRQGLARDTAEERATAAMMRQARA